MKQFKLTILLTMLMSMVGIRVSAADGDTFTALSSEGVSVVYTIVSEANKTCEIGSQTSVPAQGTITIPSTVNGYAVIGVGYRAFRGYAIYKLNLPTSITYIGEEAFEGCSSLSIINLPYGVTRIDRQAFKDCTSLQNLYIPGSVKTIGLEAFKYCTKLTEVNMGEGIETIGSGAFSQCTNLSNIYFPSTIIDVTYDALSSTAWYTNLPEGLTYIGKVAFCYKNPSTSQSVSVISGTVEIADFCFSGSNITSITLPNGLKVIGNYSFQNTNGLTSCVIPTSVTSIRNGAFSGCRGLASVNIPKNVTSIGDYAFRNCSSLTSASIKNNITYGKNVYENCVGLTSASFSNGVNSISIGLFYGCSGLTSITIPNSVTSIGASAFANCSGLTQVTIPNTVTSIGDNAFSCCSNATTITIPNSVKSIGAAAFYGCSKLTSINLPVGMTIINQMTFESCSALKSVTIPYGVYEIGFRAFSLCSSLTEITIPGSVKKMETWDLCWAFSSCTGLKSITICKGVSVLGSETFGNCSNVESVTVWNENPIYVHRSFDTFASKATLYVPHGCRDAYVDAEGWSGFKNIVEMEEYNSPSISFADAKVKALCVANWDTNNDGELSEEEAAAVTDIETVFQNQTEITSFSEFKYFTGVTTIGQNALSGCTKLATIEFPSSLQSFERYACYDSGFENIVIPDNVTSIGNSAFRNCTALSTIKLGKNSVSFGKNVFRYCTSLTSITFDGTECHFSGEDAFRDCSALTSVIITDVSAWCKSSFTQASSNPLSRTKSLSLQTSDNNISVIKHLVIPDDITTINNNTFYLCESLESIVIPSGVTSIGGSAFYGCHGLTSVTIPNSVTTIGSYVFYGCSSLPSITIPNSVTAIGSYSFYACNSLTSITIPNSVTTIGNSAFAYCNSLTSVTVERTIPVVINELTFSNRTNATLYVPKGSKAAYEAADYWKEFKEIVELPDGKLFFEGTTVRCGSQSAIPVLFESEAAYGGLQCEVTLPAGITLNKVSKTARLSDAFTLTKNLTGDNTYQILLYNTERATFAGNDGALFTMTVDVADNMAVGNYDVTLSNIVVSDVDNNQTDLRDCNAVLRVENYLLGDANRDNRVNVTDIMAVANKILKYDVPNFNEHAADVNFDNRINVTDIMGIANIILKINTAAHAPAVQLPEPQ